MSTYQYYEFLAIDRPLSDRQQVEVRAMSTRARITSTTFTNEYHFGDFSGDPHKMMERYYDAHLYLADWGTHRLMLRLPVGQLPVDVADAYCIDEHVTAWTAGKFLILEMVSEDEAGDFDFDYDAEPLLSAIVGIRSELAVGDLRPLYLAWLAGYGVWERDEEAFGPDAEDVLEPSVPPGLGCLTAPQRALADFLRLDDDLLAMAGRESRPLEETGHGVRELSEWVKHLPLADKDRLLLRVANNDAVTARAEILRRFRADHAPDIVDRPRRTVADLLDGAALIRADRQQHEAAQHAEEGARRQQALVQAREQRLDELARDREGAWARVEALINTRKPIEYDAAVVLLTDLHTLAEREGRQDTFTHRSTQVRRTHARKTTLIDRLNRAGI